jgi:hypothetical protein
MNEKKFLARHIKASNGKRVARTMIIGFSTGSIAMADVRRGLGVARHRRARAVELSALREEELDPLLESLDGLDDDLKQFEYVIEDFSLWRELGKAVCIENMDKRKPTGRTAAQLQAIFEKLPEATFCFDIGHARQIDPTMQEAETLLQSFGDRLRQVHMSHVNSQSRHERLNFESIRAFQRVAHRLNDAIPIILETPVKADEVDDEIASAEEVFSGVHRFLEGASSIRSVNGPRTPCKHVVVGQR